MNILDTRDLIETRESLQEQILLEFNSTFKTDFEDYNEIDFNNEDWDNDDLESFEDIWQEEIEHINEIDQIENDLGSEFSYGVTLIDNDDFEDYTRDLLEELGYVSENFPSWIEIDWSATASNVEKDYTDVSYRGISYLGRA